MCRVPSASFDSRREAEGAPAPRFAHELDAAAHELDQPGRDGEPETRAAVLARSRSVRLAESLEDEALLVGGDSDAGVSDSHFEGGAVRIVAGDADANGNLTPFGELDCIAGQVHEH